MAGGPTRMALSRRSGRGLTGLAAGAGTEQCSWVSSPAGSSLRTSICGQTRGPRLLVPGRVVSSGLRAAQPYDLLLMVALSSDTPFQRGELEAIVRRHLPESADVVCGVLQPAVTFVNVKPTVDDVVALWLGGGAALPASIDWPVNGDRDLFHIATVDLSVAGPCDITGALPRSGLLMFFYDIVSQSWGLDPEDTAPWRVIWVDDASVDDIPLRHRRSHESDDLYVTQPEIEEDVGRCAATTWTLPMPYEPCVGGTFYATHSWDEHRARAADFEAIERVSCRDFQMLGWPFYEQPNSRQWSVAVDSSGSSWDEITAEAAAEWMMLMQFPRWNEYGGTNFAGPSGGMLEFWIRHSDLRDRRFDRVWIQVDAT